MCREFCLPLSLSVSVDPSPASKTEYKQLWVIVMLMCAHCVCVLYCSPLSLIPAFKQTPTQSHTQSTVYSDSGFGGEGDKKQERFVILQKKGEEAEA